MLVLCLKIQPKLLLKRISLPTTDLLKAAKFLPAVTACDRHRLLEKGSSPSGEHLQTEHLCLWLYGARFWEHKDDYERLCLQEKGKRCHLFLKLSVMFTLTANIY